MDVRPIDANGVIKAIEDCYCKGCNSYNGIRCRACNFDDAMSVVEDAITLDYAPRQQWISVKDRLPDVCFETNTYKETDDVFAIDDVGDKCVGRFAISKYDGSYTFYGYTADAEERDPLIVTHWLDCMPEPPKEG